MSVCGPNGAANGEGYGSGGRRIEKAIPDPAASTKPSPVSDQIQPRRDVCMVMAGSRLVVSMDASTARTKAAGISRIVASRRSGRRPATGRGAYIRDSDPVSATGPSPPPFAKLREDVSGVGIDEPRLVVARGVEHQVGEAQLDVGQDLFEVLLGVVRDQPADRRLLEWQLGRQSLHL